MAAAARRTRRRRTPPRIAGAGYASRRWLRRAITRYYGFIIINILQFAINATPLIRRQVGIRALTRSPGAALRIRQSGIAAINRPVAAHYYRTTPDRARRQALTPLRRFTGSAGPGSRVGILRLWRLPGRPCRLNCAPVRAGFAVCPYFGFYCRICAFCRLLFARSATLLPAWQQRRQATLPQKFVYYLPPVIW